MLAADVDKQKIIATATLLIELKLIRNCSKSGHIEDVVVDSGYRGLRLGLRVIEALTEAARAAGCYKLVLDCNEENVPFYGKCGLTKKEVQVRMKGEMSGPRLARGGGVAVHCTDLPFRLLLTSQLRCCCRWCGTFDGWQHCFPHSRL